jgi:hypothetical protein
MSGTINLEFTLSGPDLPAIARALAGHPAFHQHPPDELRVAERRLKKRDPWATWLDGEPRPVRAVWGEYYETVFSFAPPDVVSARIPDFAADPLAVLACLSGIPFTVASFVVLYPEWSKHYTPPGFGHLHALLGWGCAFRGEGHDHLISQRWLEFGPWQLFRQGDISLVQFHPFGVDAAAALEQARPGHERMGIGPSGGYLPEPYVYQSEVRGLYVAAEHKLAIAAADTISPVQMRDACAVRRRRRHDAAEPVERVAYIFLNEELARPHLHEMWLRELECWALVNGRQQRLDADFRPPAVFPGRAGR